MEANVTVVVVDIKGVAADMAMGGGRGRSDGGRGG